MPLVCFLLYFLVVCCSPLFRRSGKKVKTRRYFDEVKIKWHSAFFVPPLSYNCHVHTIPYRNSCLVPTLYVSSLYLRHYLLTRSVVTLTLFSRLLPLFLSFFLSAAYLFSRHCALCILFVTLVKAAAPGFKSLSLSLSFSLWLRLKFHVLDSP